MEKPRITPAQQKQILFGFLGVLLFAAWVGLFLVPQWRKWARTGPEIGRVREDLAQIRRGINQLPAMEAQIAQLSQEVKPPALTGSAEEQLPEVLRTIAQVAHRSGLRILAAKPRSDVGSLAPGPSGYLELPILVAVEGGFHQMGTFLDALENSESLLQVREMGMGGAAEGDLLRHKAVFLFQAYLIPGSKKEGR